MTETPRKGSGKGQSPLATIAADKGGGASLEKVRQVLTPLGRTEKSRLFEMVSQGELQHAQMGRNIARILVELLNGARTEHARRLWTGWFDPILLRDDLTLLAENRLPACLHVLDAGGWWFALAGSMERLIGEIQSTITALGRELPLEQVFTSAAVRTWSEELRRESLAVLGACRGKPQATNRLVTDANTHRARLLKDRGLRGAAPMTATDLSTLEFMLDIAPAWRVLGGSAVTAEPDVLLRAARKLARDGECSPEGACLLALARVHGTRDPDFALQVHQLFALPLVRDAVIGQFEFNAQRLRQWIEGRWLSKPVKLHEAIERESPDVLLRSLFRWYDVINDIEASRDERTRTAIGATLSRVMATVETELTPLVSQRILAMNQRTAPGPLVDCVVFIAAFHTGFAQRDMATTGRPWVPAVGDHVVGLFQGLAAAASPKPDQDVLALARLAELAALVGGKVDITALNLALITVVDGCLRQRTEWAPLERRLIDRVVTMSREERRRSKWWVSEEIKSLLEIADQRALDGANRT